MLRRSPIIGKRKPPKAPKPKTCKVCKGKFEPVRPMQPTCDDFDCKVAHATKHAEKAAEKRAKEERKKVRAEKQAAKPLQYWLKRAEAACNAWVRFRDRKDPCISCGTWDAPEFHAGHFISVGASAALRFDPSNVHRQCIACNVYGAGKQADYEKRLRYKIGNAEVERLKHAERSRKWTREELQEIEAMFKAMLKEAQAANFSCP